VGSSAGGIAGGIAGGVSSGLTGILTAAFSGINALFSGIGMFQNMHMETSLNAIEHNTRYAMEYLGERADGGILTAIFKMSEQISWGPGVKATEQLKDAFITWANGGGKAGGGGSTYSFSFSNCTFGAGVSQASVSAMMETAFEQALAAHGG